MLAAAACLAYPGAALASEVDIALQGAILGKALNYDQTLEGKKPNILIIAPSGSDDAPQIAEMFAKLGGKVRTLTADQVSTDDAIWADAAYIFEGELTIGIRRLCSGNRVLSMSGSVEDVEAGRASLAVGVHKHKPRLVINMGRVDAEGHKLSSKLLKLARVIR